VTAAQTLVDLAAALAAARLASGQAGNVSVRDGDRILVSPTNASLAALSIDHLSVIDQDGAHVGGPRPTKEVALHRAMYDKNPDAQVVVHTHSAAATAVACREPWATHTALAPYTPYVLMKVGQVPLIEYRAPGDATQGELIAGHPLPFRAALLANHGPILAAKDASAALAGLIEVEAAARTVLDLGGSGRLLTARQIDELVQRAGTPWTP
jgi:3-dehydro-4-phosphotetronate decarboxylase